VYLSIQYYDCSLSRNLITHSGFLKKSGNYLRLFLVKSYLKGHFALPLNAAYSYKGPHYENKHLHHIKYSNCQYRGPHWPGLFAI